MAGRFHQYSETYLGFEPPPGIDVGFQRRDDFVQGDSYLIYISVDEFDFYLRRIPELGGRCGEEVEVVSDLAAYLRVYDPDGNRLALWRVKRQPANETKPRRVRISTGGRVDRVLN